MSYGRCHGMIVRIARYHNIFGPEGTWTGGREKAPAALCRKVSLAENGGSIEIWGDGRPDTLVSLCLRMRRGNPETDAIGFWQSGQYRL